jgi:transcriptional regulator with XRE-family HTH domain
MKSEILKDFGKTVRYYRDELGISQEQLADNCGFHRTYIGQIERGERNPSLKSIEVFAKTFNITLSELFKQYEQISKQSKT